MMTKTRIQTLDMVYIGIGIALISVCSWISVPTAVPFTLQTFAVFLVLLLLGGKRGTLATTLYVILGALGLPVFAHFTGGIGIRKQISSFDLSSCDRPDRMRRIRNGMVHVCLYEGYGICRASDGSRMVCVPLYHPGSDQTCACVHDIQAGKTCYQIDLRI